MFGKKVPVPFFRPAFSLVELLVVMGIIGTLIALLIPAVIQVRESAHCTTCQNNLKQLGIAAHAYDDVNHTLPPYATGGLPGQPAANWFGYMAPFLDQDQLGGVRAPGMTGISISTGGPCNLQFSMLQCPSDPSAFRDTYVGKSSYEANWYAFGGSTGGWFPPPQKFTSFKNGLTNAVLFAECYSECDDVTRMALETPYYHTFGITQDAKPSDDPTYLPNDFTMFQVKPTEYKGPNGCHAWRTQTPHQVMHVCLGEGSVRSVAANIAPELWKQIIKSRTGEPISVSDW